MSEPILSVRDLRISFGSRQGRAQVVNGLSYDLSRGETLAIVGESGSGKSVSQMALMQLLAVHPARVEGEALFEGRDLLALDENGIRKVRGNKIAMIFQDPMTSLNPVRTIGRQLLEPIELHLGLKGSAAGERDAELLAMVGIP
ncbi:hypothetical protein BH23ACT5_BH23ACT5_22490 [soil metagenome]